MEICFTPPSLFDKAYYYTIVYFTLSIMPCLGISIIVMFYLLHYLKFHTQAEPVPSVIDVGRIPGKGWAIIETNQAWASGLYGCDPLEALKAIEGSVE